MLGRLYFQANVGRNPATYALLAERHPGFEIDINPTHNSPIKELRKWLGPFRDEEMTAKMIRPSSHILLWRLRCDLTQEEVRTFKQDAFDWYPDRKHEFECVGFQNYFFREPDPVQVGPYAYLGLQPVKLGWLKAPYCRTSQIVHKRRRVALHISQAA